MKKNFMSVLIVIISLICVVGCGSKNRTLECIKTTDDSSGFQIKETYSYSFVSDGIETFEVTTVSTPIEVELKEFLSVFSTNIDDSFKGLKDKKGIEYSSEIKEDRHVLNIKIDYNEVDLDEFDDAGDEINDIVKKKNKKISLSETKKEMEQNDYTCEVK